MVAFNFKKEFAPRIEDGSKTGTIRQTIRCLVGSTMQLYTGQRTKFCRRIGTAKCMQVIPLRIQAHRVEFLSGQMHSITAPDALERFAYTDGFDSWQDLTSFFAKQYGLPADGYLHVWGDTFVKAGSV